MEIKREKGKDTWCCTGYFIKDGKEMRYHMRGFASKRDARESGMETERSGKITRKTTAQ